MKVTINISAKEFEYTNYILSEAVTALHNSESNRERFNLTMKQIDMAEDVRLKLVKAFLKQDTDTLNTK